MPTGDRQSPRGLEEGKTQEKNQQKEIQVQEKIHQKEEIAKHILSYLVKQGLRQFFDILTPPNFLFNFLINNSLFRKTAQLIFFHHRGLLSKKAWNEILGKNK